MTFSGLWNLVCKILSILGKTIWELYVNPDRFSPKSIGRLDHSCEFYFDYKICQQTVGRLQNLRGISIMISMLLIFWVFYYFADEIQIRQQPMRYPVIKRWYANIYRSVELLKNRTIIKAVCLNMCYREILSSLKTIEYLFFSKTTRYKELRRIYWCNSKLCHKNLQAPVFT